MKASSDLNLRGALAGAAAIAAAYIYFLIYAQFAFLELLQRSNPQPEALDQVMASMGVSGLLGSIISAFLLRRVSAAAVLRAGFAACAVLSPLAVHAQSVEAFSLLAAMIGAGLALVTVSLAAGLRCFFPVPTLGLFCGLGTGAAYFVCNLPAVFAASASHQAFFSSFVAVGGLLCTFAAGKQPNSADVNGAAKRFDYLPGGFWAVTAAFFALVWLDSAAFFVIQQTGALKSLTWGGSGHLWTNAAAHLAAALLAGWSLDRGVFRGTLFAAYIFLAAGVLLLHSSVGDSSMSAPLYCIGVSLYSTLLVAFPSRYPAVGSGTLSYAARAAWLYGISGWIGSAMGIGMAKELRRVPQEFLVIAAAALFLSLLWQRVRSGRSAGSAFSLAAAALLFAAVPIVHGGADSAKAAPAPPALSAAEQAGRRVYIAEGCIHCHSQFVRPHTRDEEMWGPHVPPQVVLAQEPPLIGNRRGGPDLLNVGNRRSKDWLRIHMMDPRATQPGSTMPSYAYLFEDERGENLVAYLSSLGRKRMTERLAQIGNWRPADVAPISIGEAQELFDDACRQCHGPGGRGDGPLAASLSTAPRDLTQVRSRWSELSRSELREYLVRTIKFGLPGTSMPGHEYYEDEEVIGLARLVEQLADNSGGD